MSTERMKAVAGHWRITAPSGSLDIEYSVEDDELYAQATGQPRFKMIPTSDSTAAFDGVEASVTFHMEEDGTTNRATHHQGGDVPMVRIDKVDLTPEQMREYEGRYYSAEIETAYEVRFHEEEGKLKAHSIRLSALDMTHKEGDEFTLAFGTLSFARSADGAITGFNAENGRTRDVWFQRRVEAADTMNGDSPAGSAVRDARAAFNAAIVNRDLAAIDGLLMSSYHIVTGRSVQDAGHDSNLAVWESMFASDSTMLYVRTPREIRVNDDFGLAEELGDWAGNYTSNGQPGEASGVYSAKWQRAADGRWLLQSEVFTTLRCAGGVEACRPPDPIGP
jgi:ketosteroid isomerase-like protein